MYQKLLLNQRLDAKKWKTHPHVGSSNQKALTILPIIQSSPDDGVSAVIHSAQPQYIF